MSRLTIASGYIINSFYDSKKDLINRPNKSILDRLISQKTKLSVYFTLNFAVAFLAIFISWRAFLYFSVYIFLIWFYSHKVKKFVIIGNLMATLMAILPFFALLLYYKNFYEVIICHATFLFLLLLIREMIKDLEKTLWATADKLRNNMDAAEYKHIVLGLIFLKYISDSFKELYQSLSDDPLSDAEDKDNYIAATVFFVPVVARWDYLQLERAKLPTIGKDIDDAMDAIEKELPENIPHIFISSAISKNLIELKDLLWQTLNKPVNA